jgi:hypothetical protein
MQNQINLTPITQFAQLLRATELSQQKEVKIPVQQARLLNLALTEILDQLNQDNIALLIELRNPSSPEIVNITMDGGGFSEGN